MLYPHFSRFLVFQSTSPWKQSIRLLQHTSRIKSPPRRLLKQIVWDSWNVKNQSFEFRLWPRLMIIICCCWIVQNFRSTCSLSFKCTLACRQICIFACIMYAEVTRVRVSIREHLGFSHVPVTVKFYLGTKMGSMIRYTWYAKRNLTLCAKGKTGFL